MKMVAMLLDITVSSAVDAVCRGAAVSDGIGRTLQVRQVKRDGSRWPEFGPGSSRAYRRHPDLRTAVDQAGARAHANGEVLIVLDQTEIRDWRTPL
ncbi:hypothetical protein ASD18_12175 [Cellulomonas sp. Root137]|nr:hypothetical protein ASD18_12175 [Cellulomonas sp. Root137]